MKETKHLSIFIKSPPEKVYQFASNPENLPAWAAGLSGSIEKMGKDWIADSPMGKVRVQFVEPNQFGVMDHVVILESGEKFYNPFRVFPNGSGSEVLFTLFRTSGMSDRQFEDDADLIRRDLQTLKEFLEQESR